MMCMHSPVRKLGLEYYQYRRALFLAGVEPPVLPRPTPERIVVPVPPPPLRYKAENTLSPKLAKLDKVLSRKGATQDPKVRERVDMTLAELRRGRVLGKGMTLSLMVSISPTSPHGVTRLMTPRSRSTSTVGRDRIIV